MEAIDRERRSIASMIEILAVDYARVHDLRANAAMQPKSGTSA
jgi:hypothetical protein